MDPQSVNPTPEQSKQPEQPIAPNRAAFWGLFNVLYFVIGLPIAVVFGIASFVGIGLGASYGSTPPPVIVPFAIYLTVTIVLGAIITTAIQAIVRKINSGARAAIRQYPRTTLVPAYCVGVTISISAPAFANPVFALIPLSILSSIAVITILSVLFTRHRAATPIANRHLMRWTAIGLLPLLLICIWITFAIMSPLTHPSALGCGQDHGLEAAMQSRAVAYEIPQTNGSAEHIAKAKVKGLAVIQLSKAQQKFGYTRVIAVSINYGDVEIFAANSSGKEIIALPWNPLQFQPDTNTMHGYSETNPGPPTGDDNGLQFGMARADSQPSDVRAWGISLAKTDSSPVMKAFSCFD